jgi:hypothetical protein
MKEINYRKCDNCNQIKQTRRFNIRYQDFTKTYKRGNWRFDDKKIRRKPYKKMWIYHTKNYNFCKECIKSAVDNFT